MKHQYEFEDDCAMCEEGIIQWTRDDQIAICDCCGLEVDLGEMAANHYNLCYID